MTPFIFQKDHSGCSVENILQEAKSESRETGQEFVAIALGVSKLRLGVVGCARTSGHICIYFGDIVTVYAGELNEGCE